MKPARTMTAPGAATPLISDGAVPAAVVTAAGAGPDTPRSN